MSPNNARGGLEPGCRGQLVAGSGHQCPVHPFAELHRGSRPFPAARCSASTAASLSGCATGAGGDDTLGDAAGQPQRVAHGQHDVAHLGPCLSRRTRRAPGEPVADPDHRQVARRVGARDDPQTMPGWLQAFVEVNPVTGHRGARPDVGDRRGRAVGWVLLACAALTLLFAPLTMHLYRSKN